MALGNSVQKLNSDPIIPKVTNSLLSGAEMVAQFESAEARNKLEDLSGIQLRSGENPYNALIKACNDDAVSAIFCGTTIM